MRQNTMRQNTMRQNWYETYPVTLHVTKHIPEDMLLGLKFMKRKVQLDLVNGKMNIVVKERESKREPYRIVSIPLWYKAQDTAFSFLTMENDEQEYWDEKVKRLQSMEKNKIDTNIGKSGFENIPINQKLGKEAVEEIRKILERYKSIFDISKNEISEFKYGKHEPLRLPLSSSVYSKPNSYAIPSALLPEFEKQMKSWLEGGVITRQKKNVEYRNNIAAVKKSDGSWRFCLDASVLNCIIKSENQPIPKINQILHDITGFQFYTMLDLSQFFLNFKLDDESGDLTTFFNPCDNLLYKFIRSPFGIRWSMSYAVRLCNEELAKIPQGSTFFRAYVDDILVYSMTLDDHKNHLDLILHQLKLCNFKVKPKKMQVAYPSAEIFGYIVDCDGFTISPARKNKLLQLKRPVSKKELQKVIGKVGYFRNIMGKKYPMSAIQAGFSDLVSGKNRFVWKKKHDETWDLIRKALHNTVKLAKLGLDDMEVILRSDSSDKYFGATLSTIRNGKEVLIHCLSKMWTPQFVHAHITQKELLAVLLAVKELRFDLIGRKVTIQVDNAHAAHVLRHPFRTLSDLKSVTANMLPHLRGINFRVVKVTNKDPHWQLTDMLSRPDGPKVMMQPKLVGELLKIEPDQDIDDLYTSYVVREQKLMDQVINRKKFEYRAIENVTGMSNLLALNQLVKIFPKLNDFMNRNNLEEVPENIRHDLVVLIHNISHFGDTRVIAILLHHNYRWKNMNRQVREIVRHCKTCQLYKASNKKLQISTTSNKTLHSGEELAADLKEIKGSSPVNILVAVDIVTGYIEAIRIPGVLNTQSIAKHLVILISRLAPVCKRIKFDNDPKLKSQVFRDFLNSIGVTPIYGARLASRSNALIERSIGLLSNQISYLKMDNLPSSSWDVGVAMATLFVNLTPRASMAYITPYELKYGRSLILDNEGVINIENRSLKQLSQKLYERIESLQILKRIMPKVQYPKFGVSLHSVGDIIRIEMKRPKNIARTVAAKWSKEIFKITNVNHQHLTYKVVNVKKPHDVRVCHDRGVKLIARGENFDESNEEQHIARVQDIIHDNDRIHNIYNNIKNELHKNQGANEKEEVEKDEEQNTCKREKKRKEKHNYNLRSSSRRSAT